MNQSDGDQISCDITLVVKDGEQFQAHRSVLSQASPFFEKLLSSDMKESNEGVIRLPTITESQMADILQFIYHGSVQITLQGNAVELIETADFLLLPNLKTIAGKFLEQHITSETCISMNYLAEQYSCEELVASTRKLINSNFTTVTASEEFLNLPSYEVEKWISSDEIVIDGEENVFEVIIRWIDHDRSERSRKINDLFSHVRLTCVSRDYLLSHVVTNDLVKESGDCLNSVTDALEWLDRSTDCDVPRPHPPRKALKASGIVIVDYYGLKQPCFYLPATDEWYLLPEMKYRRLGMQHVCGLVSCLGKVFVTDNVHRSECYDPDWNRWSSAPWGNVHPITGSLLVVRNRICILFKEIYTTAPWTYSFESNWFTFLSMWVERAYFCAVVVDSYIYVIGGSERKHDGPALSKCARFDTEQSEWQKIAPLNEARKDAFGACKNEKIFIAGGSNLIRRRLKVLNTCEVYNILTDEWQFIASLKMPRTLGSMVLIDKTLYVLGGQAYKRRDESRKFSSQVECYNIEGNEWNNKATVPVKEITNREREIERFPYRRGDGIPFSFKGCSLQVFKGVLTKLESIDLSG